MQHLQPNTTLQGGKYRIERVLGQGGFGITYLAIQEMLNRKVAIKEFFMREYCDRYYDNTSISTNTPAAHDLVERFKKKFISEASTIAKFRHPNIIDIYDVFLENNTAYYVMEYIEGESLEDVVRRQGALSEATAINYIRQVSAALECMHQQMINHLDVKPANIMLRSNKKEVVLIDFGISKLYDDDGKELTTTLVGVSEGYAPIEQYQKGSLKEFSPQTDIYALGATFYKLITGDNPPSISQILTNGLQFSKNVSENIKNLIISAMKIVKSQRPSSILSFINFLQLPHESYKQIGDLLAEETIILQDKYPNVIQWLIDNMIYVPDGEFSTLGKKFYVKKSFHICKYEVTQELWCYVMGTNPSHFYGEKRPVEMVSWDDCHFFVSKLNKIVASKGIIFRLPTDIEWEWAARGGKKSKGMAYAGGNNIDKVAWYAAYDETHNVGEKEPNELGLYDMSGNVAEWCEDKSVGIISGNKNTDISLGESDYRVIRGGSIFHDRFYCQVIYRDCELYTAKKKYIGIRLAI